MPLLARTSCTLLICFPFHARTWQLESFSVRLPTPPRCPVPSLRLSLHVPGLTPPGVDRPPRPRECSKCFAGLWGARTAENKHGEGQKAGAEKRGDGREVRRRKHCGNGCPWQGGCPLTLAKTRGRVPSWVIHVVLLLRLSCTLLLPMLQFFLSRVSTFHLPQLETEHIRESNIE